MAKDVKLVPVRVLGCDGGGTTSGVIAGLDWVTAGRSAPAVVNMSLGGGVSAALDAAVARTVAAGVPVVGAAGNSNVDACQSSPARVPDAITVGATTSSDARAEYSNVGGCLDLFAPGSSITSATSTADVGAKVVSGTSMAAPHVAGAVATYLQNAPTVRPGLVSTAVPAAGTVNRVTSAGAGSPNVLLQSTLPLPAGPTVGGRRRRRRAPVAVAPTITLPDATAQIGLVGLQPGRRSRCPRRRTCATACAPRTTAASPAPAQPAPATALTLRQQTAATNSSSTAWPTHSISGSYGGTVRRSMSTGSTAVLSFTGTQVSLVATTAANRGRAQIFLDGISQGVVDLYSPSTRTRQVVFSRAVAAGTHKLQVKVPGTRSKAAAANCVDVDRFVTAS